MHGRTCALWGGGLQSEVGTKEYVHGTCIVPSIRVVKPYLAVVNTFCPIKTGYIGLIPHSLRSHPKRYGQSRPWSKGSVPSVHLIHLAFHLAIHSSRLEWSCVMLFTASLLIQFLPHRMGGSGRVIPLVVYSCCFVAWTTSEPSQDYRKIVTLITQR